MRGVRSISAALLLSGLILSCSKSKDHSQSTLNSNDRQFLVDASYSNVAEVDAGTLASAQGSDAGVKMFGQMMVGDHGTAESELKTIADNVGVTIPQEPDSAHKAMKQMLMTLSGTTFDTTYLAGQVKDHKVTISIFQAEISNGQDTMVINYANKYLPKIQMHLMMADSLMQRGK
jgi:putative membrane protein